MVHLSDDIVDRRLYQSMCCEFKGLAFDANLRIQKKMGVENP